MATIKAVKNGNWSDTTVWSTSTVPVSGDTVYANGFTITLDQNVNIRSSNIVNAGSFIAGSVYTITEVGSTNFTSIGASSNTIGTVFIATNVGSGTGKAIITSRLTTVGGTYGSFTATAGGGFTASNITITINADIIAGTSICVSLTGCTATIVGNIYGSNNTTGATGLLISGTGTLNITGNIYNNNSSANSVQINSSTQTTIISGNVYGSSGGTNYAALITRGHTTVIGNIYGGYNGAAILYPDNTLIIVGNVYAATQNAIRTYDHPATASIEINGNIYGSSSSVFDANGIYVQNNFFGTIKVNGSLYADRTHAIQIAASSVNFLGTLIVNGSLYNSAIGTLALRAYRYHTLVIPTNYVHRVSIDGISQTANLYSVDYSGFSLPSASDVRYGISFGNNNLVGTCRVPTANNVSLGILVDNTTGTAVLTSEAIKSVIWDQNVTGLVTPNSIGARLKNVATVETTAAQITTAISA